MKRWLSRLQMLAAVLVAIAVVPVLVVETVCRGGTASPAPMRDPRVAQDVPLSLPDYHRPEAASFLSYPEWYIVHAYEDFAGHVAKGDESGFAYFSSIGGFWSSFCSLNRLTSATGFYGDMKLMLYVIGVSFIAELGIKGLYEATVGRVFEWIRGAEKTPEDKFAALMAAEYAVFLRQTPWFEYPFLSKTGALWGQPIAIGRGTLRSIERRIALSMEFLAKSAYGSLLKMGAAAAYGTAEPVTLAVLERPEGVAIDPRAKPVKELAPGLTLVRAPRYRIFADIVFDLARKGGTVVEIAGNTRLLATLVLPAGQAPDAKLAKPLFTVPIYSVPGKRRHGIVLEVKNIGPLARALEAQGASLEHIYDY